MTWCGKIWPRIGTTDNCLPLSESDGFPCADEHGDNGAMLVRPEGFHAKALQLKRPLLINPNSELARVGTLLTIDPSHKSVR